VFGLSILKGNRYPAGQKQVNIVPGTLTKTQSVPGLLRQAQDLEQKADHAGLKAAYQTLINDFPNHKNIAVWQKKLEEVNLKIIFSPIVAPGLSQEYEIQPQDNLSKIAKQFNTTVELLMRSNKLSSDKINPGRKIKVWTGKFNVLVDKSRNTLILKLNDEMMKTYAVATGLNNSTPVGTFKIVNKLPNPIWYKAGAVVPSGSPENILGTRWLGFDLTGYGIHGTTEPESIGKQATAGCVRMLNTEVEELYSLLPVGTEVIIVN
jgi:lipoprotein-anchoring transpeptidase ErfK/SrfK